MRPVGEIFGAGVAAGTPSFAKMPKYGTPPFARVLMPPGGMLSVRPSDESADDKLKGAIPEKVDAGINPPIAPTTPARLMSVSVSNVLLVTTTLVNEIGFEGGNFSAIPVGPGSRFRPTPMSIVPVKRRT